MTTTTVLTDQQTKIGKLLLNAWSAEYALRITPVINDEQYLQDALQWTFPQAYHGAVFSARALLLAREFDIKTESLIAVMIDEMAEAGLYESCDSRNAFAQLLPYRICTALPMPEGTTIRDFHAETLKKLEQVAIAHESAIVQLIGIETFSVIVERVPEYLRAAFLAERFNLLQSC
ncbi:hypothetical protein [Spirosoma sordidisoli]|uniref:Uncharacterized protein n=1 Tax=Spirosoma sordidisoli TaxID=2502893 RepID=A0A4V1RWM9_9BACT|nr:hypothetical protein [Spirosoma sordidisoli]RYC70828.1 hypothetical protein EQG79_01370 [Spirosoma sordidisoli]